MYLVTTRNRVFPNVAPRQQKPQSASEKVTSTSACTSGKARGDTFLNAYHIDDGETFTGAHCHTRWGRVSATLQSSSTTSRQGKSKLIFFSFMFCFLFFVCHHHCLLHLFLLLACYVLFQLHTSIILVVSSFFF